jgi:3'-phosphoadenosine 5'-phosphosulfate sulfotransferase (PAPS reductase)/FAD synthetase
VLLDIVRRFVDKNITTVFYNTGNEFPEILKFVAVRTMTFERISAVSICLTARFMTRLSVYRLYGMRVWMPF